MAFAFVKDMFLKDPLPEIEDINFYFIFKTRYSFRKIYH